MQRIFLAIDIGASSGRHIVGIEADGALQTDEVYRFPNGMQRENGHLIWDIEGIFQHVKAGIKAAFAKYPHIDSLSIDTWAVDYVLLKDGAALLPCHAYRDERTQAVIDEVHQHMPFAELYRRTGIQFQPFNSIYQLYEDAKTGRLQQADDFLMVPEYLLYRLCGVKAREYTNATSTGLVSAATKEYDPEILRALSLPARLFPRLTQPGTVLGQLTPDVAREVGGQTSVVLCATHDTASAVEGIPMAENAPFLSSGTWSLLGAKIPTPITTPESMACNFTNEGGVGYIRYLKNIMGLWIVQCIQKQLGISFAEMVNRADFQRQRPAFQRTGGHGGGNSRCALSRPGNRRRPHPQRVRLSGAQLRRSDSRTGTPDGSDVGEAVHRRRRREECAAERADRAVHRQGSRRPAN